MEAQKLVDKLGTLSLEMSVVRKPGGPPASGELKSTLKELSKLDLNTEVEAKAKVSSLLQRIIKRDGNRGALTETDISNALMFLKLLAETQPMKTPTKHEPYPIPLNGGPNDDFRDGFWIEMILPNLEIIYEFLSSSLFSYCNQKINEMVEHSSSENASSSGGFAYHQLLGLLQKGVRTLLVFLKRGSLNHNTWEDEKVTKALYKVGHILCEFLVQNIDVGLDIRCNISLALSYLIVHLFHRNKKMYGDFFEKIFDLGNLEKLQEPFDREGDIFSKIGNISGKDVNRIGLAFGCLGTIDLADPDIDYSELMFVIGRNIMELDHGTKEATNLGSARVLEIWTEKLTNLAIPYDMVVRMTPLFTPLEFFLFSYIPGHIDAVKNCCRNILSSLTKIYDRIDAFNGADSDLIETLLVKTWAKADHVKWIGLSCVTKNSPRAIIVLEQHKDLPSTLLCAPRTFRHTASESYLALMSYQFSDMKTSLWEKTWISPLFESQLGISNDNESNWPQKKSIIETILNSGKGSSPFQSTQLKNMIPLILNFAITNMNSVQTKGDERNVREEQERIEAIILAAETIKISSELGLQIGLLNKSLDSQDSFKGLVPRKVLHSWLCCENSQIRLAGFSLLIESKKSSELITKEDFESLKVLLKYNILSQNPAFRQQFVAYFKKLLKRLTDSQALLKRKRDPVSVEQLIHYKLFFQWMWQFFTEDEGLFPGANFGRRCQTLDCLAELVLYFNDFSIFGVQPKEYNMKYLSWLTDSYENNKMKALDILMKIPLPSFEDPKTCDNLFSEALGLCESLRPPDSVTGRFLLMLLIKKSAVLKTEKYSAWNVLQSLLSRLQEIYEEVQKTNLTDVACKTPMYGLIRAIRMILERTNEYKTFPEKYRDFSTELISLFLKYNEILFPLLGSAAPEGFLPGLPDSSESNKQVVRSITAQMLLVCSWRSMRDICLLLTDMVAFFPLEGEKDHGVPLVYILTYEQVLIIGNHLLYLLKNLMHRGVFEQVYVGFKTFATRLWKSSSSKLSHLPEKWLQEAMDEEHMTSKCITRRSAGLPFIFQALLLAESENEAFLSKWIQRLLIRDETPEMSTVRIHAMNVLRGLFRDTHFSKAMMPFVPEGLRIAFRGLKSENWTERNSGLMLYGAIMRRAFGPTLNLMSASTFFRRFPQMYDFLLDELEICLKAQRRIISKNIKESEDHQEYCGPSDFTFHLLLLLSSFACVGRVEDEHFKLAEFIPRLRECATSHDMEVRKLAARAILPFLISPDDQIKFLLGTLEDLNKKLASKTKLSLNYLHGCLTQISTIVSSVINKSALNGFIEGLKDLLSPDSVIWGVKCPTIYETLAHVLLAVGPMEDSRIRQIYKTLEVSYENLFDKIPVNISNTIPGLHVANMYVSKCKALFNLKDPKADIYQLVYNWLIASGNPVFLEQLLNFLTADAALYHLVFNRNAEIEGVLVFNCLVKRYLNEEMCRSGQSGLELKFFQSFAMISEETYSYWIQDEETTPSVLKDLVKRAINICSGISATVEHKHMAFRTWSKVLFASRNNDAQPDLFCSTLVEWSNASMDDDLRLSAARSIPMIPISDFNSFLSVSNQCKIWISTIMLAQDDLMDLRSIINYKLVASTGSKVACDRKSIETLVEIFFDTMIKTHRLEGLTVLFGLMFRDDFEFKAEVADDDDEGRLFEKSEMNMFNEPVLLAKTVKHYVSQLSWSGDLKKYLDVTLSVELLDLYELASNSNQFFCHCSLRSIIDIIKNREKAYMQEEKDNNPISSCKILSNPSRLDSNRVHNIVREIVEETFSF